MIVPNMDRATPTEASCNEPAEHNLLFHAQLASMQQTEMAFMDNICSSTHQDVRDRRCL